MPYIISNAPGASRDHRDQKKSHRGQKKNREGQKKNRRGYRKSLYTNEVEKETIEVGKNQFPIKDAKVSFPLLAPFSSTGDPFFQWVTHWVNDGYNWVTQSTTLFNKWVGLMDDPFK